jgi:dedicated sortase system histidine kinase
MAKTQSSHGLSIRSKLLFVALALILIPWMGYEYVKGMKTFLLQGQESALSLTARAVSTVLNDRPEFFDPKTGASELIGKPSDLYAYALPNYIRLDGDTDDWVEVLDQLSRYDGSDGLTCDLDYNPESLSYESIIGYRGPYLYGLFQVTDDHWIPRDLSRRSLNNSDHLRLVIENPGGRVKRYVLTAAEPGRMAVYLMDEDWKYPLTGEPNYDFDAELALTDQGYVVELRVPRFLVGSQSRLGFVVSDVDDPEQRIIERVLISSKSSESDEPLSRLLIHSPEVAKILRGLDRPVARIWVLDRQQQVRAVVGKLSSDKPTEPGPNSWGERFQRWYDGVLHDIYNTIIGGTESDFEDIATDVSHRNDEIFKRAIAGIPQTERRPTLDGKSEILMAANPVWSGDQVLGVVVVEQSSNEVLSSQIQILENVISVTLLVIVIITAALILFASRLTLRIHRLRNATDLAIGPDGRVRNPKIKEEQNAGDEIGDLSRSISSMLDRLSQYTRYLEGLPDTLAHELNNPLNVVNSSLDNLQEEIPATQNSKYMTRAKNGIIRLGSILTNLTEAANLEDALNSESRERFDLVQLVSSYVEGYQLTHPDRSFELVVRAHPLNIEGVQDLIAQMLDKLADNAVDFGKEGSLILFRLDELDNHARLTIINQGQPLPHTMTDRLFDPMVSIGKKNAKQSRLGLGLYVVKLIADFHEGQVEAANRPDDAGAMFTVSLPLAA